MAIQNMLDVISNWYRRSIIYALQSEDQPMQITSLTETVRDWDREYRELTITNDERERYIYSHIFELNKFGVINYDPAAETLRIADDISISVMPPSVAAELEDTPSTASPR